VGRDLGVGANLGVAVGVAVAVAVAVGVAVNLAVAVAVGGGWLGVAVHGRLSTSQLGVAVGHGGPLSTSTVLTVVLAVLKPSATSTRPSGSLPCACPARLPIIGGPALNRPSLMVKRWVAVVELPMESAPSVMSS
jgi:hypothetical protein